MLIYPDKCQVLGGNGRTLRCSAWAFSALVSCPGTLGVFVVVVVFINLFIYLSLAVLGLRCCTWAFSSCGERGLLFVAVRGLLIAVASLVRSTGSRRVGFSSCGTWAQELWLMGSRPQAQ